VKLHKTKLALAASLIVTGNVYAQSLPNVIVTAKPDIAEVEIDKFSAVSAVITDDTIRDLVDLVARSKPILMMCPCIYRNGIMLY
jgi:iron complex outermembrane receptor protein